LETTINPSGTFRYSTAITDIAAMVFVGIVPAASHLFKIPVYNIEPMRIMMVLTLLFTSRQNAYLLALALPVFSFLVSGHPAPMKMMIITTELILNVWLFFLLYRNMKMAFLSMFSSILLSKGFCYAMYLILFSMTFVKAEAGTTFLIAQIILTLVLSCIFWLIIYLRKLPLK
jgi:hypothetical protein